MLIESAGVWSVHAFGVRRAIDADLVEKPPGGSDWIHEVKFDGYRSHMVIDEDGRRIFTRRGLDWTSKYREELTRTLEIESFAWVPKTARP